MRVWLLTVVGLVWSTFAWGQEAAAVAQAITLKAGWNAFWLGVTIENQTADEFFKDWPIDSISAYTAGSTQTLSQYVSSQTEELPPAQSFLTWYRDAALASTLKNVHGDMVYVVQAKEAYTVTVYGRPVGRRKAWKAGQNYYGISAANGISVRPDKVLPGLPSATTGKYYVISGTGDVPTLREIGMFPSDVLTRGDVMVVEVKEPCQWSGPFQLSATQGLSFGTTSVLTRLEITNTSGKENTFTLEQLGYDGTLQNKRLTLYVRDCEVSELVDDTYTPWTDTLEKTLAAGAKWVIEIGLDRSAMGDTEKAIVDILRCTAKDASYHSESISLLANDWATHSGAWPSGIWAVSMYGTTVTQYVAQKAEEGVKVEKAMPLNLLLRADGKGTMELLQRMTVATLADAEAGSTLIVYGPNATPDGRAEISMRLSTPILPTDIPEIALTGTFDDSVKAAWTVGAKSPSNPFRHPYHPEHDGLSADYSTDAPDGDDMNTLNNPIKPELWSIKNTLVINWEDRADKQWSPEETLEGTFAWTLEGLRAEGPIQIAGPFTMRRIIVNPDYRSGKE